MTLAGPHYSITEGERSEPSDSERPHPLRPQGGERPRDLPTPPAETATAHPRHRWPYAVGAGVRPCALFGKPLMRTRTDVRLSASPRRPQEAERPIYGPFRKIHGMERPIHGLFFSFHGMFRIENRPRFVTYSGKKAHPGRPFRLSPRIGISLSGSSHFCMETAEDESAQKYRILHVKKSRRRGFPPSEGMRRRKKRGSAAYVSGKP